MDVVGGVLLDDGTECKVLTGIDDHSRYCVCCRVMLRATGPAVCGFFAQALERHGVPEEILTDNGKVFTNRFGLTPTEVLFDKICRENGIIHRLTARRRRPPPARSNASTALYAPSSWAGRSFPPGTWPKRSSTPG